MNKVYFRTLSKAVNYYTEKGYTHSFDFSQRQYQAKEWNIVDTHRFEGFTDPSDNSVLYILENSNGSDKGVLVDCYGAARDERINLFLQNVSRKFPKWLLLPETQVPFSQSEKNQLPFSKPLKPSSLTIG